MTSREQDNAFTVTLTEPAFITPNYTIAFHKDGQGQIGKMDFNGPAMVFEGDAEESARVFFDYIAQRFSERLEAERQAAIQQARDVAVKACEAIEAEEFRQYKGRPPKETLVPSKAYNPYTAGCSDGAGLCVAAIKEALT